MKSAIFPDESTTTVVRRALEQDACLHESKALMTSAPSEISG